MISWLGMDLEPPKPPRKTFDAMQEEFIHPKYTRLWRTVEENMTRKTHLRILEKVLDSLVVKSLATGDMLVEIKYKHEGPEPLEEGQTEVGVMTRLSIAAEIAELLHEHIGKIRYRRKYDPQRRAAGSPEDKSGDPGTGPQAGS